MASVLSVLITVCTLAQWAAGSNIEFRIPEERPVGYYVGNVISKSGISRDQLKVSLMKQGNGHETFFDLDEFSGNLTTKKVIDREFICEFSNFCELSLEIAAQTANNDGFFKVIRATVKVEDINDNAPFFTHPRQTLNISEALVTGAAVPIDGARDTDMSGQFSVNSYQIFPTSPGVSLPFAISFSKNLDGSSTVRLILTQQLDREIKDSYQILIVAKDGGSPPLNGTSLVNITVNDTNDNYPEFERPSYNITANEDVAIGTVILTIRATDQDAGENGHVLYRLSPHQHALNLKHFSLDEISGALKVIKQLDYNFGIPYKLIVEAIDSGDTPLMSQTFVTVFVRDTGNSPPSINLNLLPSPNISSVSEYANIGAVVAHVAVEDKDTGRNGDVNCTVVSDYFSLQRYDVKQYKVIVDKTLDRERDARHNVSVHCEDKGIPPLSVWSSFIVKILDENDNAPRFRQQRYLKTMDENNDMGDKILKVLAFDIDVGENSNITYKIPSEYMKYAYVDPVTGDIMANKVYDLESGKEKTVSFTVTAEDHGSPALTGTTTVMLTINDINDQKPVFDQTLFRYWIDENKPAHTTVGRITAEDKDEGKNAITRYSLEDSNENIPFNVYPDGIIKSKRVLDRELEPEYTFKVRASDVGDAKMFSTATVTVFVVDVNDNIPQIRAPAPGNDTVNVPYMTPIDNVIYKVWAEDKDEKGNLNSKLSYSITSLNSTNYFSINEETGDIILSSSLSDQSLVGKTFIMQIHVKDHGKDAQTVSSLLKVRITVDKGLPAEETSNRNFIIAVTVGTITVVIAAGIIVTICIIRRFDTKKKENGNRMKVLSDNLYSKNNEEVDNIYPLQMDSSFPEKKKKEVSFSLEDNGGMEYNNVIEGNEGQGHDSLDHILLEPPPQYQQLDIPKGKLDDCHSDMSGESNGDSGKGGSDDDMQLSSMTYRNDELKRPKERWEQSRGRSPGIQLQSFPTRYTPTNTAIPQQKIIPFHFKKAPSYSGSGPAMNNLSPGSSSYSVPIYYDDESRSSSGFHSVDSNSNLNYNNQASNGKLTLNNLRDNIPSDCVV